MNSLRRALGFSLALAVVASSAGACTALLGDFNESDAPFDASTSGDAGDAASDGTAGDSTSPDGVAPGADSGEDAASDGGSDGADGAVCGSGTLLCNGVCVADDATHCGTCTTTCSGSTPVCAPADAGSAYECVSGCSGSTPELCNGTCTNTQTDPQNCNTCSNVCSTSVSNATASCSGGSCGYTCGNGFTSCSGGCWNTSDDPLHCGASCSACTTSVSNAMPMCSSGNCSYICEGGFTSCSSGCWDTNNDSSHCGASCSACTGGETCQSGACACPTGEVLCGGTCVSEATNCGTCGHSCGGGTCSSGVCEPVSVVTTAAGTPFWISVVFAGGQTPLGLAWTDQSANGSVDYCGIGGCASPLTLASGQNFASQLGVQGVGNAVVWWADENTSTLNYTSTTGSSVVPWLTALSNPVGVVVAGSSIFVASGNMVYQTTGSTQSKTVWMQGIGFAYLMAADATNLYVNDITSHQVIYCGLGAPCSSANHIMASNVEQGGDGPRGLYADGANVWFTLTGGNPPAGGAVYKCPAGVSGCNTSTPFYAPAGGAYGILSDTTLQKVYWIQGGELVSCPIAGCPGAGPTVLVSSVASETALAQDPQFLYFADSSNGISKVAK